MALSATSTQEDVIAAYKANARYDFAASATMCQDFIEACRLLLLMLPKIAGLGTRGSMQLNPDLIQLQLERAEAWVNTVPAGVAGANVRYFGFQRFRD